MTSPVRDDKASAEDQENSGSHHTVRQMAVVAGIVKELKSSRLKRKITSDQMTTDVAGPSRERGERVENTEDEAGPSWRYDCRPVDRLNNKPEYDYMKIECEFRNRNPSWSSSEDDDDPPSLAELKIKFDSHTRRPFSDSARRKSMKPSFETRPPKTNIAELVSPKKLPWTDMSKGPAPVSSRFNDLMPGCYKKSNDDQVHVSLSYRDLCEIDKKFITALRLLRKLRACCGGNISQEIDDPETTDPNPLTAESVPKNGDKLTDDKQQDVLNDTDQENNDEFNRSGDNVLITNKRGKAFGPRPTKGDKGPKWIPIGHGKTLIHRDKFAEVNWKSYPTATRTLLVAAFPREVLATHTLSGRPSPAFHNRPVKMSLDAQIVKDIIAEVVKRFNVPENVIRNIITVKCADECKMSKIRMKKKMNSSAAKQQRKPSDSASNEQENVPQVSAHETKVNTIPDQNPKIHQCNINPNLTTLANKENKAPQESILTNKEISIIPLKVKNKIYNKKGLSYTQLE